MLLVEGIYLVLMFVATPITSDRVIMTNNGPVQGVTVATGDTQVEAFLGIPYAEPPIGRLRFQRPVPKTSWNGVLDASSLPPPCIQNITTVDYWEPNVENMTEDCLYLNIWVPFRAIEDKKLKPIVMFIHGGAFNIGSSNLKVYDGTNIAKTGDVIYVSMNYRVAAMGFFSAFIDEANGNMGIYDQLLAMKWVKENAWSFGGDADHLVLMGESAGSMIAAGHVSSPLTRNMFKRVILQSGASTLPMILDDNERLYNTSQKLAILVGCADRKFTLKDNPRLVVQCMKRIPARELAEAEGRMMQINPITFFPRIGDEYAPKPFIELLREGSFEDVEMLVGINEEEGNFFLYVAAPEYFGIYGQGRVEKVSRRFAFSATNVMFQTTEQTNPREIAESYIYTIQNGTSDAYAKAIGMSLGDYFINCNSLFQAQIHALRNRVYFYLFSRRPTSTVNADWIGTTHFDEMQYVFGNPLFGNFTPEEVMFSRRTMDRWLAFAKTGNPNIPGALEWPLFKYERPEYLELNDVESVGLRPDHYRCEFWRDRFHAGIDDNVIAKVKGHIVNGCVVLNYNLLLVLLTMCFVYLSKRTLTF